MSNYSSIAIRPHNDIDIDAGGNLVMVSDAEAVGQHIRQRLKFWNNEWFLDRGAGVDWLRHILGQGRAALPVAEAIIKREIMKTPGVVEITSFDIEYDNTSRGVHIRSCVVQTEFDQPVTIEV